VYIYKHVKRILKIKH